MKKKEENLTYEEYVRLRETRRLGETKKIIKQTEEQEKQKKYEEKQRLQLIKEEQKLVKKEESIATKTLNIARILKDNGVDLKRLKLTKNNYYLTLGEIKQEGVNIQEIIEEYGLDSGIKFAWGISYVKKLYCGNEKYKLTEEEIKEIEDLDFINKEKVQEETLRIARILNDEGVDFSKIQLSKNNKFILLEEIKQVGIDMQKVIEENKLDGKFEIGKQIMYLRKAYSYQEMYRMSEDERKEIEKLGLLERESVISKTLRVARILSENGIDLTKIKLSKKVGEKQEYLLLKEIEQDGIDIQKIIEENGLDEDFKLGMRVVNLRTAYNDSGTYRITQEEKKEAEELGLIPRTLKRKFEQKQIAIDKRRKAKELYDRWMKSDRERLIV